jgi:small subunit ribosomal protein S16
MSVKIRLQRHGAKKRPYYFIVVANSTSRRDGKFIEKLGTYNPLTVPATIQINRDRAIHWLHQGAQPTHTANRILSFKGVLYLKHLLRGVKLGLFDEQTARDKFEAWNGSHEILPVIKKVEDAPVAVAVEAAAEEAEVAAPVAEEAQAPEAPAAETKAEDTEAPAAE